MKLSGDDEYVWSDMPPYSGGSSSAAINWQDVVNTGIKTWGEVEKAGAAADVAKAQAQYSYRVTSPQYGTLTLPSGTMTLPGLRTTIPQSNNDTTFLLIAAGIVGAALFLSRGK